MKEIKLGKSGFVTIVDDDDYETMSRMTWCVRRHKHINYAGSVWYDKNHKYHEISMHRMIMGFPEGMFVDHIDHNGLNNQKSNLRICTRAQNNRNRGVAAGKAPYVGVSTSIATESYTRPYRAVLHNEGKVIFLGWYPTMEDAAFAYNVAVIKLRGEFAHPNKLPSSYTPKEDVFRMSVLYEDIRKYIEEGSINFH